MRIAAIVAVLLLLANAGYFAWSQGALRALDWLPSSITEREPERVRQQLQPGLLQVRVEPPPASASAGGGAGANDSATSGSSVPSAESVLGGRR